MRPATEAERVIAEQIVLPGQDPIGTGGRLTCAARTFAVQACGEGLVHPRADDESRLHIDEMTSEGGMCALPPPFVERRTNLVQRRRGGEETGQLSTVPAWRNREPHAIDADAGG